MGSKSTQFATLLVGPGWFSGVKHTILPTQPEKQLIWKIPNSGLAQVKIGQIFFTRILIGTGVCRQVRGEKVCR